MPPTFYAAIDSVELQQGDIVERVPWGLVEAPTTICRPSDRSKPSGKAIYASAELTKGPPAWSHSPEFLHGVGLQGLAVVLWHGCEIDRWKNQDRVKIGKAFAGIAPLQPFSLLPPERHVSIREKGSYHFFPMPAVSVDGLEIPESYIDLRHIWSVRQSTLNQRVLGLSSVARSSLFEHLFTFFTRQRLDTNPKCPSCGTEVPLVLADVDES